MVGLYDTNTNKNMMNKIKALAWKTSDRVLRVTGGGVCCNICDFRAPRFWSNSWHKGIICPNCHSTVRHRLVAKIFQGHPDFNLTKIVKGKRVIHFAPERILRQIIEPIAGSYHTADFDADKQYDFTVDISDMRDFDDGSFDFLIACDVLEHVYDDQKAFKEIYRVLAPGGCCMLTVPQRDGLKQTLEDLSDLDPSARKEKFGQEDHYRIYGEDIVLNLATAGFQVHQVDHLFFPEPVCRKNVLVPPVKSQDINATNHRKVFIGVKGAS